MSKSLYIAVDFDGTIVQYDYPRVGKVNPGAIETLLDLQAAGHKLILYTMRSGERIAEAVEYLDDHGVKLYAVNENPSQGYWTKSPKIYANIYIDDCALGTPMITPDTGKPYVDWDEIREMLEAKGLL